MRMWTRAGAILAAASALALAAGCSSSSSGTPSAGSSGGGATAGLTAPEASAPVPSSVGKTEGHLNLIAWEGYAQPQWVAPFQKATSCQVNAKNAASPSAVV